MNEYIYKVPVGDYSHDGHGKSVQYIIKANYPFENLVEAYRNSCTKTGYGFESSCRENNSIALLCGYGDWCLTEDAITKFKELGCTVEIEEKDEDDEEFYGEETYEPKHLEHKECFDLVMWFISLSMPSDFKWEKIDIQALFGYDSPLGGVGYGCFGQKHPSLRKGECEI